MYFKLITTDPTWYNIKTLIEQLGTGICKALPFFFSFTDCDTVSSFHGEGKCTMFDMWMKIDIKDQLTKTIIKLGKLPQAIANEDMYILETFVKFVYFGSNRNFSILTLNELRKTQFIQSTSNEMRKIAPGSSSLIMHTLRAAYQAGYLWAESTVNVTLPNPQSWGYVRNASNHLVPKWLRDPPTFIMKTFLNTCACKTGSCKSCKCAKLQLKCLPLCLCQNKCSRM